MNQPVTILDVSKRIALYIGALVLLVAPTQNIAHAQSAIATGRVNRKPTLSLSHRIAQREPVQPASIGTGPITIVALRVDFQDEGSDSAKTAGNGHFDSSTRYRVQGIDTSIDPPPHDSLYFVAHFDFLHNYFNSVSRGLLLTSGILLPGVVRVSHEMSYYATPEHDETNAKLVTLLTEAWKEADAEGLLEGLPGTLDPSRTMFVIFHAGAGRDLNLASTYGSEPTPNDLPSTYFSLEAMQDVLGVSFTGIAVDSGKFVIQNTGLLPESETRNVINPQNPPQPLYISEGINGIFAAEIGSFLGLPELYNTTNGNTAIGQIGLMDVSGMFGFDGVFPPEPMAWEKVQLGWISPVEVNTARDTIVLYGSVFATEQGLLNQTIFKIPISADEYYLLEVRRADANADGARFSTYQASRGFADPYNIILAPHLAIDPANIWGVLTSTDEYDWASFAGLGFPQFDGGIALWHIDESIIRANAATNSVNADPDHRGIALEEANGIPAIGIPIQTPFGMFVSTGEQNDLWYYNNVERLTNDSLHINEFSQYSLPPSKSNTGAPSYVKLTNFTSPANAMECVFTRDLPSNLAAPMSGFPFAMNGAEDSTLNGIVTPDGTGWLVANSRAKFVNGTRSNYYLWKAAPNGGSWLRVATDSASGVLFYTGFVPREIALRTNGNDVLMYSVEDSVGSYRLAERDLGKPAGQLLNSVSFPLPAGPLLLDSDTVVVGIHTSATTAGLATYTGDLTTRLSFAPETGNVHAVSLIAPNEYAIACDSARLASGLLPIVNQSTRLFTGHLLPPSHETNGLDDALLGDAAHQSCVYNLTSGASDVCEPMQMTEGAIANIEGDATLEVIEAGNDHMTAYNFSGAPASNIYFTGTAGQFTGNPIVLDVGSAGATGLDVLFTKSGAIQAINAGTGHQLDGFPLPAGNVRRLIALERGSELDLFAVADTGTVLGWSMKSGPAGLAWPMYKHDAALTAHAPSATPLATPSDFFPASRAFVWPNPAVGGTATHIRLYVSKDAAADCLIVNDAGEEVASLKSNCTGGTDNEILWATSSLGNGVYTCRLKVTATDGETGEKLIKIAVVK